MVATPSTDFIPIQSLQPILVVGVIGCALVVLQILVALKNLRRQPSIDTDLSRIDARLQVLSVKQQAIEQDIQGINQEVKERFNKVESRLSAGGKNMADLRADTSSLKSSQETTNLRLVDILNRLNQVK